MVAIRIFSLGQTESIIDELERQGISDITQFDGGVIECKSPSMLPIKRIVDKYRCPALHLCHDILVAI